MRAEDEIRKCLTQHTAKLKGARREPTPINRTRSEAWVAALGWVLEEPSEAVLALMFPAGPEITNTNPS